MEATAYDLSIRCCGKRIGAPSRGITKSGYNLNGKSRTEAMTISSNDLPLGTRVYLIFPDKPEYNGIYVNRDTGNMQKGVLDIFIGDYGEQVVRETIQFGRQRVLVVKMEVSTEYGKDSH